MKFEVAAVHGVPEIVPLAPKVNPVGRDPEAMLQVNGGTPPDSCSATLYGPPPVPLGSAVVVIEGGGTTVRNMGTDFVLSATDVATT